MRPPRLPRWVLLAALVVGAGFVLLFASGSPLDGVPGASASRGEQSEVHEGNTTSFIVGLRGSVSTHAEDDEFQDAKIQDTQPRMDWLLVEAPDPDAFLERVADDDRVRFVHENRELSVFERAGPSVEPLAGTLTPNDPRFDDQYAPQQIDAPDAWGTTWGDVDAAVCVVDTGLRESHEDIPSDRVLGGYDLENDDEDPADGNGHGTHVTGIAAAGLDNGVGIAGLGNVGIYAVKALADDGSGSLWTVANGITWCADNTIERTVINLSLGNPQYEDSTSEAMAEAIDHALFEAGKPVVAAAGNNCASAYFHGCVDSVTAPASYEHTLAVSCTREGSGLCEEFTSVGPEVDVAAPGDAILSLGIDSDSDYVELSGTSMSTPAVAGSLALYWSTNDTITAPELYERVQRTADGPVFTTPHTGCGEVDLGDLFAGVGTCGGQPLDSLPAPFKEIFTDTQLEDWHLDGLWHVSSDCRTPVMDSYQLAYHRQDGCDFNTTERTWGQAVFAVNLTHASTATLEFDHYFEVEDYLNRMDLMRLEVAADQTRNWTVLDQWNSTDITNDDWTQRSYDLTNWTEAVTYVRFWFDSGDEFENDYPGWYIDDLAVLSPPKAPRELTTEAGPDTGEVTLDWHPPPSERLLTGYTVYRAPSCGDSFTGIASLDPSETSHLDTGLDDGTTYCYKVTASTSTGEGPATDALEATTFAPPDPPEAFDAEAGPDGGEITLDWNPPLEDGGSAVETYHVYGADGPDASFVHLTSTDADVRTFLEDGLANDQERCYQVTAENVAGESDPSQTRCATTFDAPSPPRDVQAVRHDTQPGDVVVSWEAPTHVNGAEVTEYTVYRATDPWEDFRSIATTEAATTSVVDDRFANCEDWYYQVTATNAAGESEASSPVRATTPCEPNAPRNLEAEPGILPGEVQLSWDEPRPGGGAVERYHIYRGASQDGEFEQIATVGQDQQSYTDDGDLLTTYHYRVAAANLVGESDPSDTSCTKPAPWPTGDATLCTVPDPP